VGNLDGVRLLGLLREKEKANMGKFFFGHVGHYKLRLGAIWKCGKGTGLS
jgi:hypothetical protein